MENQRGAWLVLNGVALVAFSIMCAVLAPLGPNPLALLLLPVTVGYLYGRGRHRLAVAMVVCGVATVAGVVADLVSSTEFSWALKPAAGAVVVWYGLAGVAGLALGFGITRGWTYGRTFAATLGILFSATLLFIARFWSGWMASAQQVQTAFDASLRRGALGKGMKPGELDAARQRLESVLIAHWADISIGFMFAFTALVLACIVVGVNRWLRGRPGVAGLRTGFLEIRMPDWLVWIVIAVAGLWFANQRWPHDMLRMITWNTAICLAVLYWLSGLAVILYVLRAVRAHAAVVVAVVLLVFLLQIHLMVSMFGLFDTWADFRRRIDEAIAARKERENRGDDDW